VTSMGYNVLSGRDYVLGYDDFGVFYQCTSLTSITVDVNNPNYASIDGVLLDKSLTVLIQYPQGNTRATYTIPNSVTHIGYRAFNFSAFLTSVVIPNSVTRIERSAFMDCHSLTSVVIPSSVTHIGSVAFNFCYSLYDVYFESLIPPAVDFAAFSVVSPSARAIVPHGATAYGPVGSRWNGLIVTYLCPGCGKAPCEPCGICGECPCEVCPVDIVVGHTDGIATSGNVDTALSEAGLTRTGSRPFTVTFAPGVTSIGSAAFFNCVFLTEVVIGNSVTSIGNNAFQSCTSLTEVVIPDSVTSIGNSAFQSCTSLTEVVIPDSVTSIGNNAFLNCTSLTEVVIPDSVTSIGNSAFAFCDSLTSVVIGNSVTSIGDGAFFWCPELYEVYFQSETPPTTVGVNAFTGVKPGAMAIVPHGVTAYGAVGDLWNGLVVTWGCEDCGKVPCECRVVNYGDIDGDGRIAANDVTLLRRYIAAACKDTFKAATPFFNEANAHVRGKPCINAADVTLLRKYIASGNNDVLVPLGPPAA
jgi:putative transposon-encoded protein